MNLKNHIDQIIDEHRYQNRSVTHPDACICYDLLISIFVDNGADELTSDILHRLY